MGSEIRTAGLARVWRILAGTSLVAILNAGGMEAGEPRADPEVAPTAPLRAPARQGEGAAEEELASLLEMPVEIHLRRATPCEILETIASRYDLDWAAPADLWRGKEDRLPLEFKGSVRACLLKLAEITKVEVSFEGGMVRFWRAAGPQVIAELSAQLTAREEQTRCVAVWRLGCLGDPQALALLFKPALDDESAAVRFWARRALERQAQPRKSRMEIELPMFPLESAKEGAREGWVRRALADQDPVQRKLGLAAAGVWRVLPNDGKELLRALDPGDATPEARRISEWSAWALGRGRCEAAKAELMRIACTPGLSDWRCYASVRALARLGLRKDLAERMLAMLRNESNPDSHVRLHAAAALGCLRWEPATRALVDDLTDLRRLSGEYRSVASTALCRVGGAQAITELSRLAAENDQGAAWHALQLLRLIGSEAAQQALHDLTGPGHKHRERAAFELALLGQGEPIANQLKTGDAAARSRILRRLVDAGIAIPEADAKDLAGELISTLKKPITMDERRKTESLSGYKSERFYASERLAKISGDWNVPALAGLCRDPQSDLSLRRTAVRCLGAIGTPASCDELLKLLVECKEYDLRSGLASELGRMATPKARRALLGLLDEKENPESKRMRMDVIGILCGLVDHEEVLDRLIREARSEKWFRVHLHAHPLGCPLYVPAAAHTAAVAERISKLLDDPQEEIRLPMAFQLASLGGPEGVPMLLRALREAANRDDRLAAIQSFAHALDPRGLPASLDRLAAGGEKDPRVLAELCELVGRYPKEPRSVAALIQRLERGQDENVRSAAIGVLSRWRVREAADSLARILPESDPPNKFPHMIHSTVRDLAVDALVQLSDPRALEPLVRKLNDPNWSTRSGAASRLAELGDARAFEPLAALLAKENPDRNGQAPHAIVRALVKLDAERAVPVLIQALKTAHYWVRYDVAGALRASKVLAARPDVLAALAAFEKPAAEKAPQKLPSGSPPSAPPSYEDF